MKKRGTLEFKNKPSVISTGSIVGKTESQGPLAEYFDERVQKGRSGKETWEQMESKFQSAALSHALNSAELKYEDLSFIFSGDLLNQCTASSFAHRDTEVPYFGLYGACSTFVEGLALSAMLVDAGQAENAAVCVSSHFCTAERQYRNPLAYGGQRPPTAQRTVTGAGAALIGTSRENLPKITSATIGTVVDSGISDANNMGASMAPAAYESLIKHFGNTGTTPEDYDLIATGDLGEVGRKILIHLLDRDGIDLGERYIDCGCEMYDIHKQDVHAGASGAACSAAVFSGYIYKELCRGKWKRILLAGTGSLQSPLTVQQKETMPGICHIVEIGG